MRKFVRRHRIGVLAAALVALAVIGGAIGTSIGMVRARDSAEQARDAADEAQKINLFMAQVLTSVDPDRGKGADVRLVEVLSTASSTASQRFEGHPELEAQVRGLLGEVYARLSLFPQALPEFEQSVSLSEAVYGRDDLRSLEVRVKHMRALANAGRAREVAENIDGLVADIERVLGRGHNLWFIVRQAQIQELARNRKFVEAADLLQQLLEQAQSAGVAEAIQIPIMRGLRQTLWRQLTETRGPDRQPIGARIEPVAKEIVERSTRLEGATAIVVLDDQVWLAQVLFQNGQYEAVAEISRALLETSKDRLGDCHNIRSNAMGLLSNASFRLGALDEAAIQGLREIECRRQEEPILLVSTMTEVIPILDRAGRWSEGEQCARELAQEMAKLGGGHGPMVLDAELATARFVSLQGRQNEADRMFAELLIREDEARVDSHVLARMHMFYGAHLAKQGRFEEAEQQLQRAAAAIPDIRNGTWYWTPDDLIVEFIALYQAWGKPERVPEYERLQYEALHPLEWTSKPQ
jgi:tetratricopeptide (TPR) repeat protein